MIPSHPPTPGDRAALAAFLTGPRCPEEALTLSEAQGFLFAVACAPRPVPPTEWLPEIFGEAEPDFSSHEEAERVLGTLMGIYNEVVGSAHGGQPHLPRDCPLRDNPVANLDTEAPLAAWARGFQTGHTWLQPMWDLPYPEALERELGAAILTLTFFGWGDEAATAMDEIAPGKPLPQIATLMLESLPLALMSYARLGLLLGEARQETGGDGGEA